MSGQPLKTPSDATKYRSEYMQTLKQQSRINNTNLQANMTFLETGQLPPSTQMADTRPTAEKLLDVEYLKQSIVKEFAPIAEPMFAMRIIQGVEKSPLNIDNSFIKWIAQNAPEIVKTIKLSYKFGIAGDENDADTLVQKLTSMYADIRNSLKSVKTYMNSTTSTNPNGPRGVLSQNDFDSIIININDFIKSIRTVSGYKPTLIGPLSKILDLLPILKDLIPTTEQMSYYTNEISNKPVFGYLERISQMTENKLLSEYFDTLEKLPKMNVVNTLIDACKKSLKPYSERTMKASITNLTGLFSAFTPEVVNELRQQKAELFDKTNRELDHQKHIQSEQIAENIRQDENVDRLQRKAQRVYVINPQTDAVWTRQAPAGRLGGLGGGPDGGGGDDDSSGGWPAHGYPSVSTISSLTEPSNTWRSVPSVSSDSYSYDESIPSLSTMSNSSMASDDSVPSLISAEEAERRRRTGQYTDDTESIPSVQSRTSAYGHEWDVEPYGGRDISLRHRYTGDVIETPPLRTQPGRYDYFANPPLTRDQEIELIKVKLRDPQTPDKDIPYYEQRLQELEGIPTKRGKGRIRGKGVIIQPKPPVFIGFGINEINQKLLDKNILSIRRDTRSKIKNMNNRHISEGMKRVIKSIIGGSVPAYNDLSSLPEDEKDYLNKVITSSNLQEKLSVPAPSKDQIDKDFHQFEVMKGEILSGNDNREMIKRFKLLCLKLKRQGYLPRQEVEELMEELAHLNL